MNEKEVHYLDTLVRMQHKLESKGIDNIDLSKVYWEAWNKLPLVSQYNGNKLWYQRGNKSGDCLSKCRTAFYVATGNHY